MSTPFKRVYVIINPAAGQRTPVLHTLNKVFRQYNQPWEAMITYETGDATRLARQAVAAGAEIVAAYGGDGTLMQVAEGLLGTDVPLAILPGGTGNAMAFELGISRYLQQATELICQEYAIRPIDVARAGDDYFMLRCYTGLQREHQATREMKEQYGLLAYAVATFQTLSKVQPTQFRLTLDGQVIERSGVFCLVTNAGSIGGFDFSITPTIYPDDGLLDLFVIDTDANSLLSIAGSILGSSEPLEPLQACHIIIESDPPQDVSLDGEASGQTPLTIEVLPQSLPVLVPAHIKGLWAE